MHSVWEACWARRAGGGRPGRDHLLSTYDLLQKLRILKDRRSVVIISMILLRSRIDYYYHSFCILYVEISTSSLHPLFTYIQDEVLCTYLVLCSSSRSYY